MSSLPSGATLTLVLPFLGAVILTIIFSFLYMRRYKSSYEADTGSFITTVFALAIVLVTSALLPVDIFIVSFMKQPNGTFKDWAQNITVRDNIENAMLYSYYALYSVIFVCVFILIPFMYFYYEEKNEDGYNSNNRFCSALKFTAVFLFIAVVILLFGAFLPLRDAPPKNSTEWQKIEFLFDDLGKNKGEDAMSMVLSILSVLGMINLVFYTGFGISSWPIGLIRGMKSARHQIEEIQDKHFENQTRINALKDKERIGGRLSNRERRHLAELQESERQVIREEHFVTEHRNSLFYKCRILIRPFEITLGVASALLGFLIWLSLLLTNIDKAMHSLGPKMGYALPHRSIFNPIDYVLVNMQKVFPLDFILIFVITWFLIMCTLSGIRNLGVWIGFVRMYKLRYRRTKPQGLLIACITLMFTALAINILFYCISPQYATYGSQQYLSANSTNGTDSNGTDSLKVFLSIKPCSNEIPPEDCTMTRSSALLMRFFYRAWIFGAIYYWATWAFIGISLLGFVYVILRKSKSITDGLSDDEDLEESEDELVRS